MTNEINSVQKERKKKEDGIRIDELTIATAPHRKKTIKIHTEKNANKTLTNSILLIFYFTPTFMISMKSGATFYVINITLPVWW